jgi:hypothetical protein
LSVLAALAQSALGQSEASRKADTSVDALREQLAAGNPRAVAWAAYRAGASGYKELAGDLRRVLVGLHEAGMAGPHDLVVARAIMDSLVQVGAKLPAKELAPWALRFPKISLIAAVRDAERHAGLLLSVMQGKSSELPFIAAANALAAQAPLMAVPELLANIRVRLLVSIYSVGAARFATSGCGVSGGVSSVWLPRAEGFPPTVMYDLAYGTDAGQLLADGAQAVSFLRIEYSAEALNMRCKVRSKVDYSDYSLRCLQQLAGVALGGRVKPLYTAKLEWRDAETLRDDVAETRAQIDADFASMLDLLRKKRLISKKQAAERSLPMTVVLEDHRKEADQEHPLPKIADRQSGK